MAHAKTTVRGRAPLARDSQQWMLDYLIQETGKVFHFQGEGRGRLPRSVRSHDMISKHLGLQARRLEALAKAEAAAGHPETALDLYFQATVLYAGAQHIIFENNDEKRYLYAGVRRCYDQVIALAPYRIEHIDIPWNGTLVSGNLHLCPGRAAAPLVFYIPGCDTLKEAWPHPFFNAAHQRGMHVFSFDGPGHAESNLRSIRLTADNFEDAASAALDHLVQRSEIDAKRIGVYSISLGSFWGLRFVARDRRIRAIAAPAVSCAEKYFLMDLESPRWKQLFAYLTQSKTARRRDGRDDTRGLHGQDRLSRAARGRGIRPAWPARRGVPGVRPVEGAGRALGLRRPAPHAIHRWGRQRDEQLGRPSACSDVRLAPRPPHRQAAASSGPGGLRRGQQRGAQ